MIKLDLAKEFLTMINIACQFLEVLIIFFAVGLVVRMFINAEQATHFSRDTEYRIKLIALSLIGGSVIAFTEVFAVLLVDNTEIASSDRLIILIPLAAAIIILNVMLMIITAPEKSETEDNIDLQAKEIRKHITEQEQYINQKKAYFEQQIKFHEMRKTVDELLRKRDTY